MIKGRSTPRYGVVTLQAGLGKGCLHVVGIGRALVVLQVTGHAGGIGQLVISVDVTLRARQRGVRARQCEARTVVIERYAAPGSGRMAGVAGGRKPGLHVVGIGGAVVILYVAGRTRPTREVVIPVYVALRALHGGMRARQGEARVGMIEGRAAPGGGVVTLLAGLRKRRLHVIRVGGALKVLEVARYAGGIGQVVVPIDVALRTGSVDVGSGEWKPGFGVVKGGICP